MSDVPTSAPSVKYESTSPEGTASESSDLRELRDHVVSLRDRVEVLNRDVADQSRTLRTYDLAERASNKARKGVDVLLHELATERGMSWRDIARIAGVSRSAVRKWRSGDNPSPEKRTALAIAAAFLDLLEQFPIDDPVGWLEVPILPGYTVTAFDVYEAGHLDLLLDYAAGRCAAPRVLDEFDENWRSNFTSDWEIFTAGDGARSIRRSD